VRLWLHEASDTTMVFECCYNSRRSRSTAPAAPAVWRPSKQSPAVDSSPPDSASDTTKLNGAALLMLKTVYVPGATAQDASVTEPCVTVMWSPTAVTAMHHPSQQQPLRRNIGRYSFRVEQNQQYRARAPNPAPTQLVAPTKVRVDTSAEATAISEVAIGPAHS
jgi:hypothetical protein